MADDIVTRPCCVIRPCGCADARTVIDHLHREIERLRAGLQDAWSAADMLATQLERISSGNTEVLREYDQRREEADRG